MFDVTQEVRKIADAQGFRLDITPDDDLERLFRDPCPGIRKQLKIGYMVRGFSGTLRLDEHPMNHLRASLRIGYPPDAAEDPFRPKAAQAPKLVSMGRVLALQTPKIDARIQIREVTTTLDPGYLDMLAKLANEEKLLELREEKKKRKAERAEKRAKQKALLAELEATDTPPSRPTTPAPSCPRSRRGVRVCRRSKTPAPPPSWGAIMMSTRRPPRAPSRAPAVIAAKYDGSRWCSMALPCAMRLDELELRVDEVLVEPDDREHLARVMPPIRRDRRLGLLELAHALVERLLEVGARARLVGRADLAPRARREVLGLRRHVASTCPTRTGSRAARRAAARRPRRRALDPEAVEARARADCSATMTVRPTCS